MGIIIYLKANFLSYLIILLLPYLIVPQIPCGKSFFPCDNDKYERRNAIDYNVVENFLTKISDASSREKERIFLDDTILLKTSFYAREAMLNEINKKVFLFKPNDSLVRDSINQFVELSSINYITKDMLSLTNINIEITKELKNMGLNEFDLKNINISKKLTERIMSECLKKKKIHCPPSFYRNLTGECNNVKNPTLGTVNQPFQRMLHSDYGDDIMLPRISYKKEELPNEREISLKIFNEINDINSTISNLFPHWLQLISSDISLIAPIIKSTTGEDIISQCCSSSSKISKECMPLEISFSDPLYNGKVTCIPYTRSLTTLSKDCTLGEREQANLVTSFIDGSAMYGSNKNDEKQIRQFVNGKFKTVIFKKDSELLSVDLTTSRWCQTSNNLGCFKSGTKDVNVFPGSSALRTVMVKYHNYVADNIRRINQFWGDDKIYEETKKIIIGKIQFITYNEFLPLLLGQKEILKYNLKLRDYGYDSSYDMNINPNVFNEVAVLLNPLVLSMISDLVRVVDSNGWIIKDLKVNDTFNNPELLYDDNGVENVLRFLTLEKINKPSLYIPEVFRGQYLAKRGNFGIDAIAIALKQSRDHGLKGYRYYRQACGFGDIYKFEDLENVFYSKNIVHLVSSIYKDIDDVELIVGALGEKPIKGSLLGPTLSCILGKQFENLKKGDKFWFENYFTDSSFTIEQLKEIRKSSMAEIICKGSGMKSIQPNVFLLPDKFSNSFLDCDSNIIDKMNFQYWKDDEEKLEMVVTMETIGKVLEIAELNIEEQRRREKKNILLNQSTFKKGDPLFAWSNMMRPKERAKDISKIAEILLESTRILARGDILPSGQKLPKLSIETVQKMLPEIDVSTFISNYSAFLSDDGKGSKDKCLPENLPCDHTRRYRTYSGWCNNLKHPYYGNAFQPLKHLLTPIYDDGFDSPRIKGVSGRLLPNPRIVSNKVHTDEDISHVKFTHMVMQFGQFLDHDLTHSPTSRGPNDEILNCTKCDSFKTISVHCSPIPVEKGDPHFPTHYPNGERRCLPFARSLLGQLNLGYRSQLNQLTSYVDGSAIYGSTECEAQQVRLYHGGLLRYSNIGSHNSEALPQGNQEKDCRSLPRYPCFVAGDERNSHQPGLTMMHTIFMREHNRIARKLSLINPHWRDEKIFQESRRIHIAQFQHIVFNEFVPKIIGMNLLDKYDLMIKKDEYYKNYNDSCNGQISQPFATAAYRFGHTLIRKMFPRMDSNFKNMADPIDLSVHFGHVEPVYNGSAGGIDSIIMGLLGTPSMAFDRHITSAVRNHLFARRGEPTSGMDLVAINMLRARDHGVQTYNTFREYCGLKKAKRFNDLVGDMELKTVNALESVYESVDDIDLFPGLTSEKPLRGALLGPTMACLVAEQFNRLKRCDRFYYENDNEAAKFTLEQLREIKKIRLSSIFCQNSDYIKTIQPNVFDMPDDLLNPQIKCEDFNKINLRLWKEDSTCKMKDKEIKLGENVDITPCVSCTCTKDGTRCSPKKIVNCNKLLQKYNRKEILKDSSCVVQCSEILRNEL